MGVYYSITNLDKREFINPSTFGASVKSPASGIMGDILFTLMVNCKPYDGGLSFTGKWAGDRVVFDGDEIESDVCAVPVPEGTYTDIGKDILVESRDAGYNTQQLVINLHDTVTSILNFNRGGGIAGPNEFHDIITMCGGITGPNEFHDIMMYGFKLDLLDVPYDQSVEYDIVVYDKAWEHIQKVWTMGEMFLEDHRKARFGWMDNVE
jgi:hypothetical protein